MNFWIRSVARSFLLCLAASVLAEEKPRLSDPMSVIPKVPQKPFAVPAIPRPPPVLSSPSFPTPETLEAAIRLNAAAKDVRLLEVWSLDPDPTAGDDKNHPSRLVRFHDFRTIGREELKTPEDVQKLLHAVILAIVDGPAEASECFVPRHGLRIHGQKGFIDVVLCYQCEQGALHAGADDIWFTTTKEAEPAFDAVFARLGLRKAE
jgi:hypothetical protein